jgi:hypothetical protein
MTTNVPQDVIEFEGGKYRLELTDEGYKAFRYGEPWVAANGSKLIGIMATEIAQLRAQRQQGAEPVLYARSNELAEPILKERQVMLTVQNVPDDVYDAPLYRQPPATPDMAAGMMKAAEIIRSKVDHDKTQISEQWNGLCNDFADEILSAIPKESADALKEYVSGKCMDVANKVLLWWKLGDPDAVPQENDLKAIVNSVLGEGGK